MREARAMRSIPILCALALGFLPMAGHAQASWEAQLRDEIAYLEGCEVQFLSHIVERKVGDRQVVMAKAHCADQRVFDAYRDDELAGFTFKECEQTRDTSVC
jgi:hypothetical protein